MKDDFRSRLHDLPGNIILYIGAWPITYCMGVVIALREIATFLGLITTFKSLYQASSKTMNVITKDRLLVSAIAILSTFIAAKYSAVITLPVVAIPLILLSIIGLGHMVHRGYDHACNRYDLYSSKDKLIANLSTGALAAILAAHVAPSGLPVILGISVITGWTLAFFSTLKHVPRILAIATSLLLGCVSAFSTAGILGVAIVLIGAVFQIGNIMFALGVYNYRIDRESAPGEYAIGATLLFTTIVAVAIVLIKQLLP